MCRACDLGHECENGPGSSCNSPKSNNPLLAAIRGGPKPLSMLPGQLAAGCAIAPRALAHDHDDHDHAHPAGATAIERGSLATAQRMAFGFDAKRYRALAKPGFRSAAGTADPNAPPPPAAPNARNATMTLVAVGAVAVLLGWTLRGAR